VPECQLDNLAEFLISLCIESAPVSNLSGELKLIVLASPLKIEYSCSLFIDLHFDKYSLNRKIV